MKIEKIVVASHNQGKIKEIGEMLKPLNIAVVPAAELELPDVEETGTTFEENARLKADALSKLCGLPCLADDSGLCVDALGGRPGVYSGMETKVFEGRVDGRIATEKHGNGGFGYDPVFVPDEGDGRSFGEFGKEEKNAISHRGRAFKKFLDYLNHLNN